MLRQPTAPQVQSSADAAGDDHKNGHLPGESFTGYRVHNESLSLGASGTASDPLPEPGPVFNMAEDSALRFLLSELIEDTTPGSYGKIEENCSFVSFGRVENGRIYQEANGDIRLEPTPGFVAPALF